MRILIATDGTTHSQLAVQMGIPLFQLTQADITLLTVVSQQKQWANGQSILFAAEKEWIRSVNGTTIPHPHLLLRVGQPASEIIAEARSGQYNLIVIGQHPDSSILNRWRGSVFNQLMTLASSPLLIVKGSIRPLQKILLCESGSPPTPLLSRFMLRLPNLLHKDSTINVLHVMSQMGAGPGTAAPTAPGWQLHALANDLISAHTLEGEFLEKDIQTLQQSHITTAPIVRHGFVVDEVLAEAEAGDYGLLVIGAHQPEGWLKLLADQAQQIVDRAACPVLIIN